MVRKRLAEPKLKPSQRFYVGLSMKKPTRYLCTGRVEYAGGSKVKDIWPCGHYRVREIPTPIGPLHPDGVKHLVKMWKGGPVYMTACPTCGYTNIGKKKD